MGKQLKARRLRRILLGAVTICSVGAGIGIQTSLAGAAWSDCVAGKSCLWDGTDFPGTPNSSIVNSISALTTMNDKASSIANSGNSNISCYFAGTNFTNTSVHPWNICLNNPARGGQSRDPYLANGIDSDTRSFNNCISSYKFV